MNTATHILALLAIMGAWLPLAAAEKKASEDKSATQTAPSYVFGWGMLPAEIAKTRGGTSTGAEVTLAPARSLPLPAIAAAASDFERDRAAILSMAGEFRVSFHFMETLGLKSDYQPVQPYHSWTTEHVQLLADEGRFISLQHTLVMFFKNDDSSISEPMLTKHWRQDWTYEDREMHRYRGDLTWERQTNSAEQAQGAWTQAVFQVNDSPRYEAMGRWQHRGNVSEWHAERFWRPLPRREFSVRKDYSVLEGQDRIILTPTGWLHEQHNWKRLSGESSSNSQPGYVAAEYGLNRYERITSPSLEAAGKSWSKTGPYWQIVRKEWQRLFAENDSFSLHNKVEGEPLYSHHFEDTAALESGAAFDPVAARKRIRELLQTYQKSRSAR